jgi:hypothetical protein
VKTVKTRSIAVAVAAAVAALAGCTPAFDHVEFQATTSPPLPADLASHQVTIPEGIAVAFTAVAFAADGSTFDKTQVGFLSTSTGVLGVEPAQGGGFVVFGVEPGEAALSVTLGGNEVGTIPATVTAQ